MSTEDTTFNNSTDTGVASVPCAALSSNVSSESDSTIGAELDETVGAMQARTYSEFARGGMAIIKVGPDKVPYHIHKKLFAQHSEYFDQAVKSGSKEVEDGIVILEDIACYTFNTFVHWLYTQKLPRKYSEWIEYEDWDDVSHLGFQRAMLKVLEFADKFNIPAFRQIVECAFIGYTIYETCPYYEVITYAYEHLRPESPILRAIVDSHCYHSGSDADGDFKGEMEARKHLPQDFLISVMERYAEIVKRKEEIKLNIRDYHNHSSEEETDACDAAWGDMDNNNNNDETYEKYESDDSCESHEEDDLEDEARDLEDDLKNS